MIQHQSVTKTTRSQCMLSVVHLARVHVRVIVLVVDVVCLMLVLSALVVLLAVFVSFSKSVFCSWTENSLHPPSMTVNCVGCYRILPL